MKKINHFFCCFFLIFTAVCSIPTVCQSVYWLRDYYRRQYDAVMRKYNTIYTKPADITLESSYKERKKALDDKFPSRSRPVSGSRKVQKFLKGILPEQKDFEDALVSVFPLRMTFSEISMAFRKFIGMKRPVEYSRHYLRPDGSFGLLPDKTGNFLPLKNILTAAQAAEAVNAKFHVIVRPDNNLDQNIDIYPGLRDRSNLFIDHRIEQLKRSGISVWDMRPEWNRLPNRGGLFFRVDHHWNVYGALAGTRILASMLNRNCRMGYDIKGFDPARFQKISLKNIFLGSSGLMLTPEYTKNLKLDDFDILVPGFETDFTMINSNRHYERGDFSIFLFENQWKYDPYNSDPYCIWLDGNIASVRIINHKIAPDKGKKLLFIKDSYGSSILPYLALQTREIFMIDPRTRSIERLQKIIREEKPDFVFWFCSLILSTHEN